VPARQARARPAVTLVDNGSMSRMIRVGTGARLHPVTLIRESAQRHTGTFGTPVEASRHGAQGRARTGDCRTPLLALLTADDT
jgi:hypothetical protein